MSEIANQLQKRHSLYLAPWMIETRSLLSVDKLGLFLLVRSIFNKQNSTWLLEDMESLFWCQLEWDIDLNTRRKIPHLHNIIPYLCCSVSFFPQCVSIFFVCPFHAIIRYTNTHIFAHNTSTCMCVRNENVYMGSWQVAICGLPLESV